MFLRDIPVICVYLRLRITFEPMGNRMVRTQRAVFVFIFVAFFVQLVLVTARCAETVQIGLNYPKTGPYSVQGQPV